MEGYSGFEASPAAGDLEIKVFKVETAIETLPMRVTIGKPIWVFSTVPNPDRKRFQFWKSLRVVDPLWSSFHKYLREHTKETVRP